MIVVVGNVESDADLLVESSLSLIGEDELRRSLHCFPLLLLLFDEESNRF